MPQVANKPRLQILHAPNFPDWISIFFATVTSLTAIYAIHLVYSDKESFNDWLFHVTYTIAAGVPTLLGTYYGALHLHEFQRSRE